MTTSPASSTYYETLTEEEHSKTFAAVSDLGNQERKNLYHKFGIWERGYTLGVVSYSINFILLGRFPEYFWIWHLIKAFVYLPWRFVRFRARNMEWFMMDFCYFVTYIAVIGCLASFIRITTGLTTPLHQYNYELIRGGFAFANGALALSVAMFGNKIVFHEVDNTTSMYVHLSPALMFWTLRWGGTFGLSRIEEAWPGMFEVCPDMYDDASFQSISLMFWNYDSCAGTVSQFIIYPAVLWIVCWGVPCYIVMFCVMKDKLKKQNKMTLFSMTLEDTKGNGRLVLKLPEKLQPLGYMLQHLIYSVATGFLSIVLWNSFAIHTIFLVAIGLIGIHNGSTFMFRVVAARHVQEKLVETIQDSIKVPLLATS